MPGCVRFVFAWFLLAAPAWAEPPHPSFETDIRPIFRAHCFDCHGATKEMEGGLDLRLVRFQERGGESGPALVRGDAGASLLLQRIENGEMPPGQHKLSPAERETVRKWIAAGAPTARPEPETLAPGLGITPEERAYWAFQPIRKPDTPAIASTHLVANPVDAFLLEQLEARGLSLSPPADRAALIRRAYFDLLGLPPSYAEVQAFVRDQDPNAWKKLVDSLLASPHYGEHWGRHWLDVAGYADSDGVSSADPVRPYAYKYRDYVIRSLNADKPISDFLVEQLAGDELIPQPAVNLSPAQIEQLTATGFLRMAADGTASGGDADLNRNQVIADTIKIVSSALYGMSVGCAQCHDHRYDPIPQADYYAMRAVLEPALNPKAWRSPAQRQVSLYTDADRAKSAEIEAEARKLIEVRDGKQKQYMEAALTKELEKHPEELRPVLREAYHTAEKDRTPEQKQLLKERPSVNITPGVLYQYDVAASDDLKKMGQEIEAIRAKKPVEDFVAALTEPVGVAPVTFLFHRGDHRQPQGEISPGDLQVTSPPEQPVVFSADDPAVPTTGRRLAWAKRLTSGQHPLVARVLVNRVWMNHFGRGIVATPGEFGKLGEAPTHPALLDWLAADFMEQGWSLKALHRTIMLSNAYQQTSRRSDRQERIDGDNRLYGRMSVRRLPAEAIRDRMLVASGTLDRTQFGPAIPVAADDAGQIIVQNAVPRRSVYLQARRTQPESMLTAFDAPVMDVNCERRPSSTVASQSLMLMNGESVLKVARQLAERARKESCGEYSLHTPPQIAARLEEHSSSPWSYGYGGIDEQSSRVTGFTELPHWTGSAWQAGEKLPDPAHGWVLVHASGGHPDSRPGHAVVRRWTAPGAGEVTIAGTLRHLSPNGDGVHGRVISSRNGLHGEWSAKEGSVETPAMTIRVEPGDTIDFVTDCVTNETSDSFEWPVTLSITTPSGARTYSSIADFHGPAAKTIPLPDQVVNAWRAAYGREITQNEFERVMNFAADQLDVLKSLPAAAKQTTPPADDSLLVLTNLCQQLLCSNEFLYVD